MTTPDPRDAPDDQRQIITVSYEMLRGLFPQWEIVVDGEQATATHQGTEILYRNVVTAGTPYSLMIQITAVEHPLLG
jgi:hypothetical protein